MFFSLKIYFYSEIDSRLRKGVGVGSPSPGEATAGRRDAGGGVTSGGEVEKRLAAEKKKCEKLEEEIKTMQAQLRSYADSGSKLKEKQNQLVSFRKRLDSKDDEVKVLKEGLDALAAEKDSYKRKATALEGQISQLEVRTSLTPSLNLFFGNMSFAFGASLP